MLKYWRYLLWLVLMSSTGACYAAALPRPICPPTPIRVGFFEFGVLFSIERESGRRQGFGIDRDIAFELEKRSGCRFEGLLMSRARIWVEMEEGRLDMTLSAIKTPEREAIAWMFPYWVGYQEILLSSRVALAERSESGFLANRALKFAVVRGFRHSSYHDTLLERLRAEGRVVEAVDEVRLFEMLKSGKADAIVAQPVVYAHYLAPGEMGKQFHVVHWDPKKEATVAHLMLARNTFSAVEAEKWQALLDELRRDGTLRAIALRYFDRKTARAMQLQLTSPLSP